MGTLRYNASAVVVVVATSVILAILRGRGILVGAVALAIVLVVMSRSMRKNPRGDSADVDHRPVSFGGSAISYCFRADASSERLSEVVRKLEGQGLAVDRRQPPGDCEVVLRRGSAIAVRLLGGYFVDPTRLPLAVSIDKLSSDPAASTSRTFRVEDTMGRITLRDPRIEDRYRAVAEEISASIGGTDVVRA